MKPEEPRYINEFRDAALVRHLADRIREVSRKPACFMEVCGSHTMAIHKSGIKALLPGNIRLLSGPGCPVCVSSLPFIDHAITLARLPEIIMTTYGDLVRVPGTSSSLEKEKAGGSDIRIVYSVLDALQIAKANPDRQVVFLGIGFETTAPSSAAVILEAERLTCKNFTLLSSHKIMPPALEILASGDNHIDGFLAPGHVSAITGLGIYRGLAEKHHRAVVVSGFEPVDILQAILMLARQVESGTFQVENEYTRVVKPGGNIRAQAVMNRVFITADAEWRGLGVIKASGLVIREEFADFDAARRFRITIPESRYPEGCICGDILAGKKAPADCRLFSKVCTPMNPVGACMVSSEGSCSAFYKYRS